MVAEAGYSVHYLCLVCLRALSNNGIKVRNLHYDISFVIDLHFSLGKSSSLSRSKFSLLGNEDFEFDLKVPPRYNIIKLLSLLCYF